MPESVNRNDANGESRLRWGFFSTSVLIPILFVVLMNILEGEKVQSLSWSDRLMKIAWDLCVLALGLSGGVFSNPDVIKNLKAGGMLIAVLFSTIIALGTALGIAWLRNVVADGYHNHLALKVCACLAMGGGALAVPSYYALTYGSRRAWTLKFGDEGPSSGTK